jgi:hypothetical protein
MNCMNWTRGALAAVGCLAAVGVAGAQDAAKPKVVKLPTKAPRGAVVLLGKNATDVAANWYQRRTTNDAGWTMDAAGVVTHPKHAYDITSKKEFGDCFIHVEFQCSADADGKPLDGGNSGVGLQGRYEIQINNSFGKAAEMHECGAVYDRVAPIVIASKKAGEWQTYDIKFTAPKVAADGAVTARPRVTVWQNGILIQDNTEIPSPTGIQYGDFKGEVAVGPIVLQGDHDVVNYRNIWVKTK